jgi:membrane protein implicated in regulation of membrane protease activity
MLQGWLSIKVISAFGTGFGAAGLIASANGLPYGWSLACAIGSGVVLAIIIRFLIGCFRKAECNSSFSRSQLVGKQGAVILGILDGAIGEAQFVHGGELVSVPSKSEDGKAIPQGSQVIVVSAGSVMVVRKA